jgi:hypothetical protein
MGSLLLVSVNAQDLTTMSVKNGLKATGGINVSNIFYHTTDTVARRDPYQVILTGNLNLNIFGYNTPFSFTYSNSQKSYTQPFNRLSFTPQYKWIKAYLGYTSMSFSPYTLSGHSFKGGGVELSPGNWRLSLMAGQLKKAVEYNPLNESSANPSYERMGYGIKLGYEKRTGSVSVNIFTAKDAENSLKRLPATTLLHPMLNVAFGVSGRTKLPFNLIIEGEYSMSILASYLRQGMVEEDSLQTTVSDINNLSPQIPGKRTFSAVSSGIGYQSSPFGIMLRYERVAPGYQTLGAYYFNNDMENITIVPNLRALNGRLSVTGNIGIQRNNLDISRESTTKRWVRAGNINFIPTEKWNLTFNFSNFSTYTNMRPPTDPFFRNNMDSLNFYQVTNQMGGSVNYIFGNKEARRSIMLNSSYQEAIESNPGVQKKSSSGFITVNTSYSQLLAKTGFSVSLSYNLSANNVPGLNSFYQGPGISLSRTFLKQTLRAGLNSTYNINKSGGIKGSPVLSSGLNISLSPKQSAEGKHRINFNLTWLQRFPSDIQMRGRREITGNMNYAFTF